jgi:hypothetical protein
VPEQPARKTPGPEVNAFVYAKVGVNVVDHFLLP